MKRNLERWILNRIGKECTFLICEHVSKHHSRPGRILHALGRLRAAQGREAESFEFDQRALASFLATIGKNHHRTADLCHRVAEHMIKDQQYEEAL